MSTTTSRPPSPRMVDTYRRRKAVEFARQAIRQAGPTQAAIAASLDVSRAAVANWVNRTVHPELREMMLVVIGAEPWSQRKVLEGLKVVAALNEAPETSGRPIGEMVTRASDIRDMVSAPVEKLLRRGHFLWLKRHEWNGEECAAAERGDLERWGTPALLEAWGQIELQDIVGILRELHGFRDPFATFREMAA